MIRSVGKFPVVVLAGGLGTRLKKIVADRPKPMAPINGKPFLEYVLDSLYRSNLVSRCILSVGYLHEQIEAYFGNSFKTMPIDYSIEGLPLGTGGAVKKAIHSIDEKEIILMNGDTMFSIDLSRLIAEHQAKNADISIALKKMYDFNRYGTVDCRDGFIRSFEEKKAVEEGLINGGIYIFNKDVLLNRSLPDIFSLEKDFLQVKVCELKIGAVVFDNYFIDIGIPEDFSRAQNELKSLLTE